MKKISISAVCLFLFSSVGFAQEDVRPKGFAWGLVASPDYSFVRDPFHDNYTPAFSFSGGLAASYQLTPCWGLSFGLEYSQMNWKTIPWYIEFPSPGLVSERIYGSAGRLNLPVKMDFYLSRKKTALYLTGGFAASVFCFSRYQTVNTFEDGHTSTFTNMYSNPQQIGVPWISPQLQIGLGLDCGLHNSRLRIEPLLRIASPTYASTTLSDLTCSAALRISWFFQHKK